MSSLVIFSTNNLILIDELHCIVDQVVDGADTAGGVDAPGDVVEAGLAVLCPVVSAAVDVLEVLALLLKLETVDVENKGGEESKKISTHRSVLPSPLAPGAPGWSIG